MNEASKQNLATARRFLEIIENAADASALSEVLHRDFVATEFPNRISPAGQRRDMAGVLAGFAKGRQLLSSQHYEIASEQAVDERVVLEVEWTGTLAVTLSEKLPAGFQFRAHLAIFLDFRDGLIVAQRNYDCYDSWD